MNTTNLFEEKILTFNAALVKEDRKYNQLATLRFFAFLILLAVVIYAIWKQEYQLLWTLVVFPIPFGLLVNYHRTVKNGRDLLRALIQVNQDEILRLDHNFQSFPEGNKYKDPLHHYAKDLDLFGRNSLYQLINRSHTPAGNNSVAKWLKGVDVTYDLKDRQAAVKELEPNDEWRQLLESKGKLQTKKTIVPIDEWLYDGSRSINAFQHILGYVMPMLNLFTLSMVIFNIWPLFYLITPLLISQLIIRKFLKISSSLTLHAGHSVTLTRAYSQLIEQIETSEFESTLLIKLKQKLFFEGTPASNALNELNRILNLFSNRGNMFYGIFNTLLFLDIHLINTAENWRDKYGLLVNQWFNTVGEFETVNSLAGFSFANPTFNYPAQSDKTMHFTAKNLGHPLIPANERVINDFSLSGKGSIAVITGSNMSGKSTFLRTIGVNLVLANMGCRVCATQMQFGKFQLFTGMRTEDNLEEHVSSFYAELKRIKQLLNLVETGRPVLFMLDEILKGTNSADRHKGAAALINQLSEKKVIGFVSTHDLELGDFAAQNPTKFANYSFNSTIENDKIIFDYKITPGICRSFNASQLMKNIGIKFD